MDVIDDNDADILSIELTDAIQMYQIETTFGVPTQNKYGILQDLSEELPSSKTSNKSNTAPNRSDKSPSIRIPPIIVRKVVEHSTLCSTIRRLINADEFQIRHTRKLTNPLKKGN